MEVEILEWLLEELLFTIFSKFTELAIYCFWPTEQCKAIDPTFRKASTVWASWSWLLLDTFSPAGISQELDFKFWKSLYGQQKSTDWIRMESKAREAKIFII